MEILVPKNVFLRVGEKFSVQFVRDDAAVKRDPQDVYIFIFSLAADTGVLRGVSQQIIADKTKMCPRAVQYALRALERLGYLHVESVPGQPSTYILLFLEHVRKQILQYGSDLIENPDWYPRDGRQEGTPRRRSVQASSSSPTPSAAGRHAHGTRGGIRTTCVPLLYG